MALLLSANPAFTISGKHGGNIFSSHPDGNHISASPRRYGHPPSLTQIARRAAFSAASHAWRHDCTNQQRLLWTYWADRHPRTGLTGHQYTMTGRHAFLHINIVRTYNRLDPILNPPAD